MTAEIAILNRNGVALAADSAGTLVLPSGPKLTNTERKLFRLSKYAGVGVMVYGASQLMGVPWETIIKTYRQDLKAKTYEHLEDYASDFMSFLEREELLFPAELQYSYAGMCIEAGFRTLRNEIDEEVNRITSSAGSIKDDQIKTVIRENSLKFLEEVEKSEYLHGFGADDVDRFTKSPDTTRMIQAILEKVFANVPIGELADRFQRTGVLMLCNQYLDPQVSGVVVAGFGERDIFPALVSFECDGVVNKKLRRVGTSRVKIGTELTGEITGSIRPFAQREMVDRFMNGIDGQYRKFVDNSVSALLSDEYPRHVLDVLDGKIKKDVRNAVAAELRRIAADLNREFTERLDQYQQEEFAQSILDSVDTLPKVDLAAMAEALVNLTAFKRRMTYDEAESVSVPIDVAIISKGEGFIWIKKKHYFEPSLNPDFFRK
jgi:hypothetical protein